MARKRVHFIYIMDLAKRGIIMRKYSWYNFNSMLINSFQSDDVSVVSKPGETLKYHYTSPEAFCSILKNKQVYFTDIRFMNDMAEDVLLIDLIREFAEKNAKKFPKVAKNIDLLLDDREEISDSKFRLRFIKRRKFLFCTCTEPDSLPMWNYYVNNGNYQGYNVGFNLEKLLKSFDTDKPGEVDPFEVLYGRVIYTEKEYEKELEELLETIERNYTRHDMDFARVNLLAYVDRCGPFFKHRKFEHEKEYRIVIEVDDDYLKRGGFSHCFGANNKKIVYDFRTKQGLLVPFLKVTYNAEAVSRIDVSPMTEYQIAEKSVREILQVNGFKGVQIHKSSIPIRF